MIVVVAQYSCRVAFAIVCALLIFVACCCFVACCLVFGVEC